MRRIRTNLLAEESRKTSPGPLRSNQLFSALHPPTGKLSWYGGAQSRPPTGGAPHNSLRAPQGLGMALCSVSLSRRSQVNAGLFLRWTSLVQCAAGSGRASDGGGGLARAA
ncbi:hypothetical protein NDU88_001915 [Pleurodeles waltl]|uniref:Uncharacterized protein n=1 Tax=Pleurodeles waltl TaxID=8319 RepID=A0AAV7S8Q6_PLEWA|nr:hypothetical protein NDU88_001915 [Pleurodeles waltl]